MVACLHVKEFLANICGLPLMNNPDQLFDVTRIYDHDGQPAELMKMLEQSLDEDTHSGPLLHSHRAWCVCTPSIMWIMLMGHINIFWGRINIFKVLQACEKGVTVE